MRTKRVIPRTPREPEEITVYTDGACEPSNPGPGGWAWCVLEGRYESGGEPHSTNQRMELTAVLRALEYWTALGVKLTVISDSQYVVNCFLDRWHVKWLATNWKNGRVKNRDLWEPLIELALTHDVTFRWVRGHTGDRGNELADTLASAAVPRF